MIILRNNPLTMVVIFFTIAFISSGCGNGPNDDDLVDAGDGDSDGDVDGDADGDGDAGIEPDGSDIDGDVEDEDGSAEADVDATPTLPTEANTSRLSDIVEDLSADEMNGRLTGTASGDLAEEMVHSFLEDTGIDIQTQLTTFPLYEVKEPIELSLVNEAGEVQESFAYINDFREVDFSGSGSVVGDLVFVGYGIELGDYHSYEGVDVEGKIAVVLSNVPPNQGMDPYDDGRIDVKVNEAFEHGAVGMILVPAGVDADYDQSRTVEAEFAALDKYLDFHSSLHHPTMPVAFIHVSAVEDILGASLTSLRLDTAGRDLGRRVRLEVNGTVHERANCRNILGYIEGSDPEVGSEVIILGAHYDHIGVGADGRIFNGASDNASGAGIVLETAAALMESGFEPRRTIVFALWCAEEQGFWGSLEYAIYGQPLFPMEDTILMLQVDWIGNESGPYLSNGDNYEHLTTFAGDERTAVDLPLVYQDWQGECASDDCPFLWSDVPAYRFSSPGTYHHVAEDDFENLDMVMVDRVADICIRGLGYLAY